jgi:GNAT superfamily N-acetyltransferase
MATIKLENGFINYTVEETEITIDNIKVYEQKKGTGRKLIEEVKKIARENNLPIGLYSEPQDDTINTEDLKNFYYSCGFELDPDDSDGKLFIWK